MANFIKLQQFKEYEFDHKHHKPQLDKPVYTDMFVSKEMDIIISASGKKGHSVITTSVGTHFYEVKGSPETIKNLIEKELMESPKKLPDPLPKPTNKK